VNLREIENPRVIGCRQMHSERKLDVGTTINLSPRKDDDEPI